MKFNREDIIIRVKQLDGDTCECGALLKYRISPFITEGRCVCKKCGRITWINMTPIDWNKVCKLAWGKL